jgi:DNA-binding transcriptional regulator YiaG
MANVAKALKEEISRISRKEARSAVDPIGKSQTTLKKVVADLKKRLVSLEKENKRLVVVIGKEEVKASPKSSEEPEKGRLTPKSIRSLRSRLALTQADFAKLVGASPYSVHLWETKEGALNLRDKTKAALLSISRFGAKDAKGKLAEIGGKLKKRRDAVSKKKKRS